MKLPRPLIVGSPQDEHVQAVAGALVDLGLPPVLVDCPALEQVNYSVQPDRVLIGDEEVSLVGGSGWIRRLTPPNWRPHARAGSREAAVRSSFVRLLVSLIRLNDRRWWVSTLKAQLTADDKIAMAAKARSLSIPVPSTVSVSDPEAIPASLGADLLVKAHGPGHFADEGDRDFVVHARRTTRDEIQEWPLRGAPFLVQEFIDADEHLRVVTVGARAWVTSQPAKGLPADWRESTIAHESFRLVERPGIAARATQVAAIFQLGFSSQDWIKTGDKYWLLDINPAGQWLFLPDPIPKEVSVELATGLVRNSRK